ncbi:unnamed protein product [Trichobilharzia regenti]|nr:unnamed protein product [Trichobilharzia regenti]
MNDDEDPLETLQSYAGPTSSLDHRLKVSCSSITQDLCCKLHSLKQLKCLYDKCNVLSKYIAKYLFTHTHATTCHDEGMQGQLDTNHGNVVRDYQDWLSVMK